MRGSAASQAQDHEQRPGVLTVRLDGTDVDEHRICRGSRGLDTLNRKGAWDDGLDRIIAALWHFALLFSFCFQSCSFSTGSPHHRPPPPPALEPAETLKPPPRSSLDDPNLSLLWAVLAVPFSSTCVTTSTS